MFYQRKIYPELLAHAQLPAVTVLTGMRRTGKTTLVLQLLAELPTKNSLFLDFQRADIRELFLEKNYEVIRESFVTRGLNPDIPMIVALDEIQLAPESPSVIKYLSDHYHIKFIVTGSSSYYLKNLFSESLSGRKKIFELYPLDFGEFLTFKNVPHRTVNWVEKPFDYLEHRRLFAYYEEFVRYGGFPQVVLAQTEAQKHDILLDIMSSYINIDVRSLADFSDERNLYALAKLLAGRVGSRVEYTKLSSLTGLSRPTVTNYISFFEKTYLISTVPVYTKNVDREIVKARKLYFCDTGLANTLSELSSGAQFENTLYNQLARLGGVQYFALKTGHEIDFILGGNLAIEAKETPIAGDLSRLAQMASTAGVSGFKLVGRHKSPKFTNYAWAGSVQNNPAP
ncbi:ATP-binding protein [Candidatus Roizmanbacteria bacterium]|nr:ATP-binding protein [Candidatus Roizmanbacteria bacterium]